MVEDFSQEVGDLLRMADHLFQDRLLGGCERTVGAVQQKLVMDVGREAQKKVREVTETVDNFAKAKEILEARGMKVNAADVASFRKIAEEKIWPQYRQQYAELWDKIVATK